MCCVCDCEEKEGRFDVLILALIRGFWSNNDMQPFLLATDIIMW